MWKQKHFTSTKTSTDVIQEALDFVNENECSWKPIWLNQNGFLKEFYISYKK